MLIIINQYIMKIHEAIILGCVFYLSLLLTFTTFEIGNHRKATEDLPQPPPLVRDYQIEVDSDSIYVWDGTREVGSAAWDTSKFDSILLRDNQ